VGRYLEHGRIFVFHNNGDDEVYLGSSDWMERNIYRRIEVCFPLYDADAKREILRLMALQLEPESDPQAAIYRYLQSLQK
jgi:polyphosphate kinase